MKTRAKSFSEIDQLADDGIELAAKELEVNANDIRSYYLAGGEWDAETSEELADLIVACWQEQAAAERVGLGQ